MKIVKVLGGLLAVVAVAGGGFAAFINMRGAPHYPTEEIELKVESTPERVARGKKLASMLCFACHEDHATGRLTGADMKLDKQFGNVHSYNITRHATAGIGTWTDGELAFLLRTGIARDGRYTPPWMTKVPHMSDEDLASIIAFLRSDDPSVAASDVVDIAAQPNFLSKFLMIVAFKPLPYPKAPIPQPSNDPVELGRYLAINLDCYTCHSEDFSKIDTLNPPKTPGYFGGGNPLEDVDGNPVHSTNLTPDLETGIGKWSDEQFVRALREGVRPDSTPIRVPMTPYPQLTVEEAKAIYAYLRTVPPIVKKNIAPQLPTLATTAAAGEKVYFKYGCNGCHGANGVGLCDLTKNKTTFATDDELVAFIENPPAKVPDSRMPIWRGVIKADEMKDLVAHVRSLGK